MNNKGLLMAGFLLTGVVGYLVGFYEMKYKTLKLILAEKTEKEEEICKK